MVGARRGEGEVLQGQVLEVRARWMLALLELMMGCLRMLELEMLHMLLLRMVGEEGMVAEGQVLVGALVEVELIMGSWDGVGERGRTGGAGECIIDNIKDMILFLSCKISFLRCDSYETWLS